MTPPSDSCGCPSGKSNYARGPMGPRGATGEAGPNILEQGVTKTSETDTGLLKAAAGKVEQAVPDVDYATPGLVKTKVDFLKGITGFTGGSASDLDSVPLAEVDDMSMFCFIESGGGLLNFYLARLSGAATSSPDIIRASDHAESGMVFERVQTY